MVLLGTYRVNTGASVIAATGLIFSAVYALWMVQRTFQGEQRRLWKISDLSVRETGILAALILAIFWLGFFPRPVLNTTGPMLNGISCCSPSSDPIKVDPVDRNQIITTENKKLSGE
jgi:NADH-quinone oxidoreductase subunit M